MELGKEELGKAHKSHRVLLLEVWTDKHSTLEHVGVKLVKSNKKSDEKLTDLTNHDATLPRWIGQNTASPCLFGADRKLQIFADGLDGESVPGIDEGLTGPGVLSKLDFGEKLSKHRFAVA